MIRMFKVTSFYYRLTGRPVKWVGRLKVFITNTNNLSSIPRAHVKVKGKN